MSKRERESESIEWRGVVLERSRELPTNWRSPEPAVWKLQLIANHPEPWVARMKVDTTRFYGSGVTPALALDAAHDKAQAEARAISSELRKVRAKKVTE